jgi:hypothetical protein
LTLEEVQRRRIEHKAKRLENASPASVRAAKQARRRKRRAQAAERVGDIAQHGNKHSRNRISLLWGRHEGMDAFVVGTGTSLTGFDFSVLNGRKNAFSIGLNDAVMAKRFKPEYSLFCDTGIWARYRDMDLDPRTIMVCQPKARSQFLRYERCTYIDRVWHFNHVGNIQGCVKSDRNDDLFVARTVATGGIMMAWKLGARRVFLLGVDGYKLKSSKVGGTYYYDGKGKGNECRKEKNVGDGRITQDRHAWWITNMKELRGWFDNRKVYQEEWPGSNVYNLSEHSEIKAWKKVKPEEVLCAN